MRTVARTVLIVLGVAILAEIGLVTYAVLQMPNPRTNLVTLRSGRKVEVVSAGTVNGSSPTWVFEYRTHIPMGDRNRLQIEVAALWRDIEDQADQSGLQKASVWPVNFDRKVGFDGWKPVIVGPVSTAFSLQKGADGVWERKGGWCP